MPNLNNIVKQKSRPVTNKPLPGKLVKGVSMVKKLKYAEEASAKIKGLRVAQNPLTR